MSAAIPSPAHPTQPRAQVSDNLRMLADALQPMLDHVGELLSRREADGSLPADVKAEATARLSSLVHVLGLAGADAASGLLSMVPRHLATDPAVALQALQALRDYLDALYDKSSDTDIDDLMLFSACRRMRIGGDAGSVVQEVAKEGVTGPVARGDAGDTEAVRSRAAAFGQALAALHADEGHEAVLAALHRMESLFADVPEQAFIHDFISRLATGSQALDAQALAVLDSLSVLLAAQTRDPASLPVRTALARRRIDFLSALAVEEARAESHPAVASQQMLRLMLLADELQVAWDRCVTAGVSAGRVGAAWQWCESVLRAGALSRRIWPRQRGPGLTGLLTALGRLAFDLAMSPRIESRDRELSNCLIFFYECLRRRVYLEDDFPRQVDCIVDHLALLAYGEVEPEPFPWFSRELRADMARRMEGVVESALEDKLAQVEHALTTLWSPTYVEAMRARQASMDDDVDDGAGVSPQVLIADVHAELAQIGEMALHLRCPQLREQAAALRRLVTVQLPATLRLSGEIQPTPARHQDDAVRAGMVRDLVRLRVGLEQARRSPHNKWRRHLDAQQAVADGARIAAEIRRALETGDATDLAGGDAVWNAQGAAAPAHALPPPGGDDEPGAWQPEEDDPEMLDVFLTEAGQLLAHLAADLPRLTAGTADIDLLADVRRSFHTFKGSGRMVGLNALSDAAQAVEMLLNVCLAAARSAGRVDLPPAVTGLLQAAYGTIVAWVAELQTQRRSCRQAPSLMANALALRGSVGVVASSDDTRAAGQASREDRVSGAAGEPREPGEQGAALVAETTRDPGQAPLPPVSPADAGLRQIFLTEARQLFKVLRQHGSSWRARIDSGLVSGPPPLYRRAIHTLRGSSAAAGFVGMQQMATALDGVLEHQQVAASGFDAASLSVMERSIDAMRAMLEQYGAGGNPELPALLAELIALAPSDEQRGDVVQQAAARSAVTVAETAQKTAPTPVSGQESVALHDEIDHDLLPVFLEEGHDLLAAVGERLQRFQRDPADLVALTELRRPLHTVKGSARMAGALQLGHRMHELETGIQRLLVGRADAPDIGALLALFDQALLQFEALEQLSDMPRADVAVTAPVQALSEGERRLASPLVRVKAAVLDRLLNQVGELSIARSQLENEVLSLHRGAQELADNIAKLAAQLRDVEIQAEIQIAASHQASHESAQFDPLELDRFTHLQELTRMMAESVNDVDSLQKQLFESAAKTQDGLQMQERLTRELQRELMSTRMIKFSSIDHRLQHLARQLAGETGKQIALEIAGGGTEIDRSILERMVGPLEHLLRNAAVHGLETEAERSAADKPPAGRITLQAAQEGNEAVIRLSDDGRGLDLAAIRHRATELGIAAAEALEPARLPELIFEPGFSTSQEVSALAGRGVGMDVVRAEVAALGGRVAVQSKPGEGVRFTMHLPLSLAVKQVCLLRHGSQSYAIPSMLIEKVVQLRGDEMRQALAERAVAINGRRVGLHSLHSLLDEPPHESRSPQASIFVLFVKSGDDVVAILVDHVNGNREVVSKPLGPQLGTLAGVAGVTVLGNGEIVLIINPLLLAPRTTGRRSMPAREPGSPTPARKLVMVVDDSLTVRKVMQRLLMREGYAVAAATDGYDAIRQLHEVTPDVFLIDIEMPRMDGFTLVRYLHDNSATRDKPVIMITSRTGAKHRERAMEVGVNYYLGKPYQDEQLLDLVRYYASSVNQRPPDDFSDVLY